MRIAKISLLLIVLFGCGTSSRPDFLQLEAQGETILEQIEQHKATHDVYPSSLSDVNIVLPNAPFGGWRYHSFDDLEQFELAIGDYKEHMFVLFWNSRSGNWHLDT